MIQYKSFRFPAHLSQRQKKHLEEMLEAERLVQNDLIELQRTRYKNGEKHASFYELYKYIKGNKLLGSIIVNGVALRVTRAYQNFFRRCKDPTVRKKGAPKFKKVGQVRSLSIFYGIPKLRNREIFIAKLGRVRFKPTRPIEGKVKVISLKKERTGKYFITFVCETDVKIPQVEPKYLGLDLGINNFIATSDGKTCELRAVLYDAGSIKNRRDSDLMCKVKKAGRVGRERTERKLFTLYLLLFLLISAGFAIGFAPSSKNVYFTNNQGEDYFTFSNPTGETYTCSMELNNSQVGATYSEGNPFTTSETSFQIIATYTVPSGFIPNTVKMVARCTKGAGGQQSIVNEFNRQLGFLLQPTTTTIPTITTTIPPTTTTVPPTTTTTIRPSTTTTTIGSPFPTTTTNQPSTTTTTPLSTTTSSTTTTVPTTTTTSIFYAPSFRPITTSVQSSTTSVPSTTIPTTTTIQLMSPPEEVPEIDIKAIGVGIVVLIAGAILIGAFSAI